MQIIKSVPMLRRSSSRASVGRRVAVSGLSAAAALLAASAASAATTAARRRSEQS
jgi:hypothetical protein